MPGRALRHSALATLRTRAACSVSTLKRACSAATDWSRKSPPLAWRLAVWRSCRSMITPWRSAPLAGLSAVMPKCVASVYSNARPPPMMALRSSRKDGNCKRSTVPAARHWSMHQRRPSGVMVPSVTPAAARICDTAPAVPDEPSASRQWRGANGSSASSSSAPAATWALRKPCSVNTPPGNQRIDRLTLPVLKDSTVRGSRPWPTIISVLRPPISITSRGLSPGCKNDTPA